MYIDDDVETQKKINDEWEGNNNMSVRAILPVIQFISLTRQQTV